MTEYRTEYIDTPAGRYTVELHYDEDSPNPLTDWDQEGLAFYIYDQSRSSTYVALDTLDSAGGDALAYFIRRYEYSWSIDVDDVERRFSKWAAITGSPYALVAGYDSASQSDSYRWFVLVKRDPAIFGDNPNAERIARAIMHDYQYWASGQVCGFITKSPDDEVIESIWGFYDDDEALEQGETAAECDAADRVDAANHAGAGFVGIV